ncbi:hypothetical protein LCM17_09245 [Cereibacter sphaeroides]|nr:hypothetical protein [Cereibacter sphaeroides]
MNRFATTAVVAAFAALSAVAANAADLRGDATLNAGETTTVRAGNVYSARELATAGLQESDLISFEGREQVQVRAGDVYSSQELKDSGFDANDVLTVSNFAGAGQVQDRQPGHAWRDDR